MGKPIEVKTRKELIATLKPKQLQYLRADNGDLPEDYLAEKSQAKYAQV
jgi:hypothetical protein